MDELEQSKYLDTTNITNVFSIFDVKKKKINDTFNEYCSFRII